MEIEFQEVSKIIETCKPLKSQVEKFNIFSILHKENEERRLHSRFIAALLDPEGSHGMRYKFLYTFLELNGLNYEDFGNASVYPNEVSKKELNFIDILIIDEQSKKAIIIENKINAGDSNNEEGGQLERYFKHVRDDRMIADKDIKTYYLSPNKRKPSAESLGEFKELSKINGECISYPDEINKWLDSCLQHVEEKSFIAATISQYQNLITKMVDSELDIQVRKKVKDKIGDNDINMISTKYIVENFHHIKWHTVADFWADLSETLKKNGFEVKAQPNVENITALTHKPIRENDEEQDCGIKFTKEGEDSIFWIWNEPNERLFWGADNNSNGKLTDNYKEMLKKYVKDGKMKYYDEGKYWFKYCLDEDNEIRLQDFTKQGTFDLISKQRRTGMINKIVEEIITYLSGNA